MIQIICKDLTLGYDGQVVASNINFKVNKGDYLCVVGENGSGKSTLIKTLLQLVRPISGTIEMHNGFTPKQAGYLPQQTEIQKNFPASVKEVVLSGCSGDKRGIFFSKKHKETAELNMKRLGISDIALKSLQDLSGGQQQRVFLARAMCSANGALMLDEPISGLDPLVTSEMYDTLKKINTEDKTTILMVSHDINSAIKYATHILHIGQNTSFYGSLSEYLKSDLGKSFVKGNLGNA